MKHSLCHIFPKKARIRAQLPFPLLSFSLPPNAQETTKVISAALALGKIPEAKHLLASITCNLVHISEMVDKADTEKREDTLDAQGGHKADPKRRTNKPDAEGGKQPEGGAGAQHQYARHGRAALPRHHADSYLPVLQGEPLPLRHQMAAPTANSVDETLARAAGRPPLGPRPRKKTTLHPHKPKVPTRKKTTRRSNGALIFLACLGGGLLVPCVKLVFARRRAVLPRPSESGVDQAHATRYWPHPPAFDAALSTTASTTIISCENLRGAVCSSYLPAHTAPPEPVARFSSQPKKSTTRQNRLNRGQDQDPTQHQGRNYDQALLHDCFVIPVGHEVTSPSKLPSRRAAELAGYSATTDDSA